MASLELTERGVPEAQRNGFGLLGAHQKTVFPVYNQRGTFKASDVQFFRIGEIDPERKLGCFFIVSPAPGAIGFFTDGSFRNITKKIDERNVGAASVGTG